MLPGHGYCSRICIASASTGLDGLVVDAVELVEEPLDEERHVLAAVPQRRQLDREDVQPVVEILAQLARAHRVPRVLVGRGDDADVHRLFLASAEPAEAPLLEHAQQLDLRGRLHLGDLVEEQRAAVRELEDARAAIVRAGERPLLVAEDLALEQRLGNRGAVDRDERETPTAGSTRGSSARRAPCRCPTRPRSTPRPPSAPPARSCDTRNGSRRLLADDASEAALLAQLPTELPDLAQRLLPLDRLLQQDAQPRGIDGLAQVVVSAFLDRFDGGFDGALRGEQDDRQIGQLVLESAQQLDAAHARHHQIRHDDRGRNEVIFCIASSPFAASSVW
jgi:hypothetical protein